MHVMAELGFLAGLCIDEPNITVAIRKKCKMYVFHLQVFGPEVSEGLEGTAHLCKHLR